MKLKNENFVYGAWKIFEKYFNFEISNKKRQDYNLIYFTE